MHDVLLAEGMPCEGFLDTGNRAAFANGAASVMLHAEFALRVWQTKACADLVREGGALTAVRAALLSGAGSLGHATTMDPDLHLLADAIGMKPMWHGEQAVFALPERFRTLRLCSRTAVSAQMKPWDDDTRGLGVAVSCLVIDGVEIPCDDATLDAGWHAPEPARRWTSGAADLPAGPGAAVAVTLLPLIRYWQSAAPAPDRISV